MTRSTLPDRRMKRTGSCRTWPAHTRSSPTRRGVEGTTSTGASMHGPPRSPPTRRRGAKARLLPSLAESDVAPRASPISHSGARGVGGLGCRCRRHRLPVFRTPEGGAAGLEPCRAAGRCRCQARPRNAADGAPAAEVPARPSGDGASGVITTPSVPQAAAPPQPETRPAPPKAAVAKTPPANRPADASPAAACFRIMR